jgi:hypothetical protein
VRVVLQVAGVEFVVLDCEESDEERDGVEINVADGAVK